MGAGASAAASVSEDSTQATEPIKCSLKGLPDAMDEAVFVREKWPLVVDPTGQAGRFLRYQRGSYLLGDSPADMEPDHLRPLLLGALKHGSTMCVAFSELGGGRNLEVFFSEDFFPRALVSGDKNAIFDEQVWGKLLRPEQGDPPAAEFQVDSAFKFVVFSESESIPPELLGRAFVPVLVGGAKAAGSAEDMSPAEAEEEAARAADAQLAEAIGVKNTVRNSPALVDAAFEGDLDEVKKFVEQGYSADSVDGRKHSAISEAACCGKDEVLLYLLELGADPNKLSDTGRSPLYRAAFGGHESTVALLLAAGADPKVAQKGDGEGPYDVAKTDEVRAVLDAWKYEDTVKLKEERKAKMRAELEKRLETTAEREALARDLIRQELVELAVAGNTEGIQSKLEELSNEAEREGAKRARGTAECRDQRGCTLLMLACEGDHAELVELLLTHHKTVDEDNMFLEPGESSMEARTFRTNVNARDAKGWNAAAIATFRKSKNALRLVLGNGGDATVKNQYGKSAIDLAEDVLDAAKNVYEDNSEIRAVLEEFNFSKDRGSGIAVDRGGGGTGDLEGVGQEGTAMLMNIEMNNEAAAAAKGGGSGGGGKTKKGGTKKGGAASKKKGGSSSKKK